ncbi:polyisoprenoid-binding protein YceI [Pseudoclavibacter chungangensis]|uniref:YceI family protein n=1 Tax=Pseudoclavibacter chungangensis TaxID=587635 RepID=UPI0015CED8FA|nr:YceI family protein [Pseudoclavibacter chungangensis]NYJ68433.1 polyisoprenoid-binding protein YceI [Pseudoclavibacter chungangensis]
MTRAVDSRHDRIVGTWVAEQSRSRIEFRIGRRLVGRFERYAAIAKTAADPADTSIRIVVHAASFRTEEGHDRGDRLRSIVVLRSNEFPSITYRASDFERTDDGIVAHGELTVNGIARPFDAVADVSRPVTDEDGRTRLALGLRGTVRRADYRLGAGLERRVRDVDVTVRLVFVLQGSAGRLAPDASGTADGPAHATTTAREAATRAGTREADTVGAVSSDAGTAPVTFVAKLPPRADRRDHDAERPARRATPSGAPAGEDATRGTPWAPGPTTVAPSDVAPSTETTTGEATPSETTVTEAPVAFDGAGRQEAIGTMRWRTAADDHDGTGAASALPSGSSVAPHEPAGASGTIPPRTDEPVVIGAADITESGATASGTAAPGTDAESLRATATAGASERPPALAAVPRSHGRPFWRRLLDRFGR